MFEMAITRLTVLIFQVLAWMTPARGTGANPANFDRVYPS